ncbi:alkylated DNA repair protein (DNA oxidative demethylase) [Octadecabacter temperatus]|jgi:alkylated DNA repair protein (DNA oxidative demethylase)|uniref:Alpha-ketoglutarate-dependent dioxygenase AlkB n=2 Tax=Octadecabacter temperatus TaxID=1458307 RepID=A0A0K0Y9V0_9RHOB|nr:Alpha-ketoglutarate-dependent dioxygenase AlkB [Octadecabacter temperatus]SIO40048.1 alkylated DNA repair protein (DNA oxidative demethylase) [Octadecabacter temperatus]
MRKNGEQMNNSRPTAVLRGVQVWQGLLDRPAQEKILQDIRAIVVAAPLFSPMTPYGKPMSVQMTSAGRFGWVSDRSGYRYSETHPNGKVWPAIPSSVLNIWEKVSGSDRVPECCLINLYRDAARMGMHQDRDEAEFREPVVSVSLGDEGLFRVGNLTRGGKTESIWLNSGDVVVMGGDARLVYHGIDKTRAGSSSLLNGGGRINLTLRVVT